MELKKVPIKSLKMAGFNPSRRTKNAGKVRALQKSIEAIGLQYPILVTKGMDVVDGHRRLLACTLLGWEEVPVLVTASDHNQAYADVNATAERLSGNDTLNVYLTEPAALTPGQRGRCERAEAIIGKPFMRKLAKGGYSLNVYRFAWEAAKYCDQDTPQFIKAAMTWILANGTHQLREAVVHEAPANTIREAIRRGNPLKARYV